MIGLLLAAAPASQPAPNIHQWFDQLGDQNPQVRDKAIENLMGLSPGDLPALQKAVEQSRPIRPSQKTALRDVVTQVFMSGVQYPVNPPGVPFLGLSGDSRSMDDSASGLVVTRRLPGFAAYRMLRDGDVINAIEEKPDEHFDAESFKDVVKDFHPGQVITLRVLRNGNPMRIPVQLRARPNGIEAVGLEIWFSEHQMDADKYWDQHFAALVGDDVY
ncbi:MAG TPA: S1C family serine protease [Tepidisphaeraceae bacterium]|nr:S1C family serine protease [Tepidisphaeraceae bacterium]